VSAPTTPLARVAPVFTIVASLVYFLEMSANSGWLMFYPRINEIHFTRQPADAGEVMFWYGWVLDGLVAGAIASIAALALPRGWLDRGFARHASVAVGLGAVLMIGLFILLREYFMQ
jgi:hypothetical protein